jgi:hypothetical protein
MKISKVYKYIRIADSGDVFDNHPVYGIYHKKSKDQIGLLSYYSSWKQYVFSSHPDCVFNNSCLRDVLDFMENETKGDIKI